MESKIGPGKNGTLLTHAGVSRHASRHGSCSSLTDAGRGPELRRFRDMQAIGHNHPSRIAVTVHTPFRFLVAVVAALLIATLIVSSAAHALALGDATAQSTLGSPLRVVVPVTVAPGESLQPGCFRVVPAAGDGSAQIVTARVSLERAAGAPRLVVTTTNSVNEPAIRLSIQGGCNGPVQRVYVVLLDPPASGSPVTAAATQVTARGPRQERPAPQPSTARHNSGDAAPSATQVAHVPEAAERHLPTTAVAPALPLRERAATVAAVGTPAFRPVAATTSSAGATSPPRVQTPSGGGSSLWSRLAAAVAIVGVIALAAVFARRRDTHLEVPQWTRSPSVNGPRSFADLSVAPATAPHTFSRAGATTTLGAAATGKPKLVAPSPVRVEDSVPPSRRNPATVDPSTIDTLLDELNPDVVEERAVREAWAAARSDVERELDGNAILQAIDAAERDLRLASQAPRQSAIERELEDDVLQPPQRR